MHMHRLARAVAARLRLKRLVIWIHLNDLRVCDVHWPKYSYGKYAKTPKCLQHPSKLKESVQIKREESFVDIPMETMDEKYVFLYERSTARVDAEFFHLFITSKRHSCIDIYSYSCLHPLSNERKSMFKSGDSRAV